MAMMHGQAMAATLEKAQATLDTDSEDGSVGLPGDADYDFSTAVDYTRNGLREWDGTNGRPAPASPAQGNGTTDSAAAAAEGGGGEDALNTTLGRQQALGFEILGFQTKDAGKKAPPKGLADRLADGARKGKKKPKPERTAADAKAHRRVVRQRREAREAQERKRNCDASDRCDDADDAAEDASAAGPAGPIGVNVGLEPEQRATSPPPPLSDEQRAALSPLILYFGESVAQHVKGARWSHRLDAITCIREALHDVGVRCTSNTTGSAAMRRIPQQQQQQQQPQGDAWQKADVLAVLAEFVICPGLDDAVFQVFSATVALLTQILNSFVNDLLADMVRDYVLSYGLIGSLTEKLAASNARARDVAKEALVTMSHHSFLGVHVIAEHCLLNFHRHTSVSTYKLLIGKINLLASLLQEHELSEEDAASASPSVAGGADGAVPHTTHAHSASGTPPVFTMENAMQLTVFALGIVNPKIRRTTIALVVDLYRRHGKRCEQYFRHLPASVIKTLKQEIEIELCDVEAFGSTALLEQEEEDLALLEKDLAVSEEQRAQLARWGRIFRIKSLPCIFSRKWRLRESVYARLRHQLLSEVDLTLLSVGNIIGYVAEMPTPSANRGLGGTLGKGSAGKAAALGQRSALPSPAAEGRASGSAVPPEERFFIHPEDPAAEQVAFQACFELVSIGVQDTIPQLVVSCAQFASAVLEAYAMQDAIGGDMLRACLGETLVPRLIAHVSSATQSVAQVAMELLLQVAHSPKLGADWLSNAVMRQGVTSSKSGAESWKVTLARVRILTQLVQLFDFNKESAPRCLSTEDIMKYAVGSFQCTNGKVRGAAVELIIEVYKKCGNVIRVYLRNQKPALLTDLKDKIAKVARKDRTKSAPIQTLASMVQPLGVDDGLEGVMPSRPATFPSALEVEDSMAQPQDTMKAKIQRWKHEQQMQQRSSDMLEQNQIPVAAQASRADSSDQISTPGVSAEGADSRPVSRGGSSSDLRRKSSVGSSMRSGNPTPLSKGISPGSCVLPPRHGNHQTRLVLG